MKSMFYKLFILIALFLYADHLLYSQDVHAQIEMLEHKLKASKGADELKLLNNLADKYRSVSVDKSNDLANEALEKAKKQNNKIEQSIALNNLGKVCVVRDQLEQSIKYFESSFALSNTEKYIDGISKSLNNICYAYGKLKDAKKVEIYHRKAIGIFVSLKNFEELGNFYLSFGEVFQKNSQLDSSKVQFEKAMANFMKSPKKDSADVKDKIAAVDDKLASIYIEWSDYKKAMTFLQKSLVLRKEVGDKKKIISTQSILGKVYTMQGDFEKAIDLYQQNLKISQELNYNAGIANSLNCIAPVYMKLKQNDKAIEYFKEALDIYEQMDSKGSDYAACLNNIANVYKELNDHKKSVEYYLKALDILQNTNSTNSDMATLLINIGDEYEMSADYKKALEYYQKALNLQEEVDNKEGMARSLFHIAGIYNEMKNYLTALDFYNKSLAISQEINVSALYLSNLQKLSDTYKMLGQIDKALEYKDQYIIAKEIVVNQEMNGKLTEMQTKYDSDKKQHQIEIMGKEKEVQATRQRFIVIASVIGLLTLLITVFFIYNRYRMKKKSHADLELKNQHIMQQKEEIEAQRDEIEIQKQLVEEKNHEVMDSIRYAKRIQSAVMPRADYIDSFLNDYFIIFKPKDIVSGDYYWMTKRGNWLVIVAADCTGHGVPGAFMSMLGISFLNEIVSKSHVVTAAMALNELRAYVVKSLQQKGVVGEQKDGMDIVFTAINMETLEMHYSGANNPLYLVRNAELTEYKADKMPIAIYEEMKPFTDNVIQLQKGDTIYMNSDGYEDQFGGPKGKKFMSKQFKNTVVAMQDKSMVEQGEFLDKSIEDWKAFIDPVTNEPYEQIDDILVIGVRF